MCRVSRGVAVALALATGFAARPAPAQTPRLDSLIAVAEAKWPALAARRAEASAARARAAEAERAYRPSVSVGGSYTLAAGGRVIALPLGDLLNDAYATLNQLTQSASFPQLENEEEPLLANNFYDARVRVEQPLYRPEIAIGRERSRVGIAAAEARTEATAADLREAVRAGYLQLLSARRGVEIYAAALTLVEESYRTTASLVRNGAALPLARERIVAERARLRAERTAAERQVANARARLNHLLGNDLDAALPGLDAVGAGGDSGAPPPEDLLRGAGAAELPELRALRAAVELATLDAELERQWRRPRVGLRVDGGSQDFDFGLQPYALAGLSVEVALYDGGRHAARAQRIAAERDAAERRVGDASRSLALREEVARNNLAAAEAALAAYAPAVAAAERTERDARRLYRAGETGYVELLDAQSQLTRTRLERNLAEFGVSLEAVRLLRARGR